MSKTRSPDDILSELLKEDDAVKKHALQEQLWNLAPAENATLFFQQDNGLYQITFLHQSFRDEEVELSSTDLYDDKYDTFRKFNKIPDTNIYILQLEDIPGDTFATYKINVNGRPSKTNNNNVFAQHRYDLETNKMHSDQTLFLQLPDARLPAWVGTDLPALVAEPIETIKYKSNGDFAKRDIFIDKPNNWENINSADRKVIFMLDGKGYCELLTPYIAAQRNDTNNNNFANTAIVYVGSGTYSDKNPGRVIEYYFQKDDFAKLLGDVILPTICSKLNIINRDNVTLAAHSLAAYPVLETTLKYTDQIGGMILMSPALNLRKSPKFPKTPDDRLSSIPIYMQIGQLENEIPCQSVRKMKQMKNQSRLESTQNFHQFLLRHKYQVEKKLVLFASGHSEAHVIDGLNAGLQFIRSVQLKSKQIILQHDEISHAAEKDKTDTNETDLSTTLRVSKRLNISPKQTPANTPNEKATSIVATKNKVIDVIDEEMLKSALGQASDTAKNLKNNP
jgi:predicted alpha/beta superfamily hydrolase